MIALQLTLTISLAGVGSQWLVHELDHENTTPLSLTADNHRHAALQLNDNEHRLLHSLAHFPPLLATETSQSLVTVSPSSSVPTFFYLFVPYMAEQAPPFRPPQNV